VSETRTVNGADAIRSWQGVSLFGLEGFGKKNESRALGFSGGRLIFDGERARLQRWPRVGVKHRNEQWRVVPDWNFDLQERESRTADDVFALARKVETLPQEVESAVRNWSRQEHLEERLGTLEKAIKTLLRELRNTQSTYGPFGVFLGSPDSPPDPWTQAQCTSALLIGAEPLVNVRGAFDYIHQSRRKQAWPRTPEEPLLSIEATAHAGLVVLRGLRAIRTGSDLDENTLRESLDVAYAYVRAEQKPSLNPGEGGSWASLSQDGTGERPAAEVATYSALRFLLEYRREGLRPNEVEGRIQRGLNWIQAGYQGDIRGWKDQERTAPQRDIALLFLTVAALAQETERPTFKGGNGLWIDALRKLFTTALRDTGFEAGVPRTIMQPQGRWMFSPVQIAWYPLLLSLALRTGTRDWLPLADRALSLRVVDMLWEQLSSYVKEVTTNDAPTYLVADAALALLEGREALAKLVSKSTGEASVALSP
jgi:hypothetical protein